MKNQEKVSTTEEKKKMKNCFAERPSLESETFKRCKTKPCQVDLQTLGEVSMSTDK